MNTRTDKRMHNPTLQRMDGQIGGQNIIGRRKVSTQRKWSVGRAGREQVVG